jgi:hypothetical protein
MTATGLHDAATGDAASMASSRVCNTVVGFHYVLVVEAEHQLQLVLNSSNGIAAMLNDLDCYLLAIPPSPVHPAKAARA